jgi:hypothetical protein
MQYLAGLQAQQHAVFYLEDCGRESWVYNWETGRLTTDLEYPAAYVRACLEPLGLGGRWIYRAGNASAGMSLEQFTEVCSEASLMIICCAPLRAWRPEYDLPGRRAFIDVDPGFTQIRYLQGEEDLVRTLDRCDSLFTIAQRLGKSDCLIPATGRQWHSTLPPVSLDCWKFAENPAPTHFTTIMQWRGFHDVVFNGTLYGQKDREFPKFVELPRRTSQTLRIALLGKPSPAPADYGWDIVPAELPSRTPWSYMEFIQESRAEFGIAKHAYVQMRGGWFSDRSVCYLASGRPVLVQDTGQSDWIPTGLGIVTFRDLPEAVAAIERINDGYDKHRQAARRLAEEYFAVDQVLPRLLDQAMD